mmetsp:Transcript_29640/g.65621  ORF Transcript_29640/g.65621 Transcript_29640/m.65621 type:complete len:245 (-) Transcript_29640:373-1107(-)
MTKHISRLKAQQVRCDHEHLCRLGPAAPQLLQVGHKGRQLLRNTGQEQLRPHTHHACHVTDLHTQVHEEGDNGAQLTLHVTAQNLGPYCQHTGCEVLVLDAELAQEVDHAAGLVEGAAAVKQAAGGALQEVHQVSVLEAVHLKEGDPALEDVRQGQQLRSLADQKPDVGNINVCPLERADRRAHSGGIIVAQRGIGCHSEREHHDVVLGDTQLSANESLDFRRVICRCVFRPGRPNFEQKTAAL